MEIPQSQNWSCLKSIDELIEDAKFVFINSGYKGYRPMIVLNTPINGYDCIEIDYDRYGVIDNGCTRFSNSWGDKIKDSSVNVREFIIDFLIKSDTGLIKPQL